MRTATANLPLRLRRPACRAIRAARSLIEPAPVAAAPAAAAAAPAADLDAANERRLAWAASFGIGRGALFTAIPTAPLAHPPHGSDQP